MASAQTRLLHRYARLLRHSETGRQPLTIRVAIPNVKETTPPPIADGGTREPYSLADNLDHYSTRPQEAHTTRTGTRSGASRPAAPTAVADPTGHRPWTRRGRAIVVIRSWVRALPPDDSDLDSTGHGGRNFAQATVAGFLCVFAVRAGATVYFDVPPRSPPLHAPRPRPAPAGARCPGVPADRPGLATCVPTGGLSSWLLPRPTRIPWRSPT